MVKKIGLVLLAFITLFIINSCKANNSLSKKWANMYKDGKYKELLVEVSMYTDRMDAKAYAVLSNIKLKNFGDIEIPDADDVFFENVENFLKWRECIFRNETSSCSFEFKEGSSLKTQSKFLKEIFEHYKKLPVDELRKELSISYSKMIEISKQLKNKELSQSELIEIKGELNKFYDDELYKLPSDDIRKKLYKSLISEIDKNLKLLSVGIDRPQN